MRTGASTALRADAAAIAVGVPATLLFVYVAATLGPATALAPPLGLAAFAALLLLFVSTPHVAVAALIPLLALTPFLKVFVSPSVGAVKDLVVLAAGLAGVLLALQARSAARHRVDRVVALTIGLLLALYVLNLGGGFERASFDPGWFHGVRLVSEPLVLLLVGLVLPNARRTFSWGMTSLVATCGGVALYGLVQQALGHERLVELGYEYAVQVRDFDGILRSFGTLDEPFGYAALLLFGAVGVLFWTRRGTVATALGALIAAGLVFSFVRTAAIIGAALLGLWLARRGQTVAAIFTLVASVVGGLVVLFATAGASESQTVRADSSLYLTLNGRTEVWRVALGEPSTWAFGRGVGEVGTAAARASRSADVSAQAEVGTRLSAVDSGYFSTIADVGFVGLALLLALLARLLVLAARAARAGRRPGWVALALLVVLLLDALTRDSFTGFPTAFAGLLLLGLALAASADEERAGHAAGAGRAGP